MSQTIKKWSSTFGRYCLVQAGVVNTGRSHMARIVLMVIGVFALLFSQTPGKTPEHPFDNELIKIYRDESHCLTAPEIRSDNDKPSSCYCRDTLADMRYMWNTYLLTEKDSNLNGAFLSLVTYATLQCGPTYPPYAVTEQDWQWDGPKVLRNYLADEVIQQLKPDEKGFRTVPYQVQLIYRDAKRKVVKVESFTAYEKLPPNWKKWTK